MIVIRASFRTRNAFFSIAALCAAAPVLSFGEIVQAERVDVAKVWSAHPVDFDIQTAGNYQFIAYYDTLRRMTVARRTIGATQWQYTVLPQTTGWDSHNYIAMALDDSGYVHVSGNMHNVALVYYRSTRPYDMSAYTAPGMVGSNETSVTYPVFIKGPNRQFIYQYRDGGSGNGTTIWNGYALATKRWSRITSSGLFNGGGTVNAYHTTPVLGPDGYYHIIWMWRETPVANTNHDISHMKSLDLVNWRTMAGATVTLPVTQSTAGVVVDPVPSGNGLINMDFWISWDSQNRPVVTYHKYRIVGTDTTSQIFNTRWESTVWRIYQTSNWTGYKWFLDLQGSLAHEIAATPLEIDKAGRLLQYYVYRDNIRRQWVLNEATLSPLSDSVWQPPAAMQAFYQIESTWSGTPAMQINQKRQGEYYLRWETLPQNQDLARNPPYPPFSMLRVYRFIDATAVAPPPKYAAEAMNVRLTDNKLCIRPGVLREGKPWSAQVYLLNGRVVAGLRGVTAEQIAWNTAGWARGVYCVRIGLQKKGFTEKIALY